MLLEEKILELKKKYNAIILAHYYQDEEIQDIADFIGDSLELSKKAMDTEAEIIVFCGVKFMAEVAKIFNPTKKVLLPDLKAGCSLEESCRKDDFEKFIENYPDHTVLTYINCSAEIKSLSDIICTSSSAEKIINKLPKDEKIIFAPDKYLGGYLNRKTGRDMVLWNGTCVVHERFSERELIAKMARHKNAYVIAHPECNENILKYASFIGSTSALLNFTIENKGSEFIVLTEEGIIHQMKKKSIGSTFYAVEGINEGGCVSCNRCPYMQMNTMEKLYCCLRDLSPEILLDEKMIFSAKKSLDKMFEILQS